MTPLIPRFAALVVVVVAMLAMGRPAAAGTVYTPTSVAELQAAVAAVNAGAGGDTILLAPGVYAIAGGLTIGQDVTIQGDPNAASVLDGGGASTLLMVTANNVQVQNITLQNAGTAIDWQGTGGFSVSGVTITGTATDGFYTQNGGQASFINSTIAFNAGRGIEVESPIVPFPLSALRLTNVTVSHNSVGLYSDQQNPFGVSNSLIVANGVDCHLVAASASSSIDGDATCATTPPPCGGPICPVPVAGFQTVAFPALGLDPNLGANGGPTLTEAIISATSPAIGAGNPDTCQFDVPTDQRGAARKINCDLGAYEFGAIPAPNTPVGSPVPVSPFPSGIFASVSVTFSDVTVAGDTTVVVGGPPPPSGFMVGGVVYDITTTAVYTAPITVCVPYDSITNPIPKLSHYENGTWLDKTLFYDAAKGIVCGSVSSLSPFAVLVPVPAPSNVPFKSFTAHLEIERPHKITKHASDSFEIEGRGLLGAASNGIAPDAEEVTVKIGAVSLTIPAGSFMTKVDKDDDHGKMDRDDRTTTYRFKGVIAGVSLEAEIEAGPKHAVRFQFEGRQANLGVVANPVAVELAIGDDVGHAMVKADIDK